MTEVAPSNLLEEIAPNMQEGAQSYKNGLKLLLKAAIAIPAVARGFSAAWPRAVRDFIPGAAVGVPLERTWTPLLAYMLFHALPGTAEGQAVFDALDMRSALADTFTGLGFPGEDGWRYAARIRLLLGGRVAFEELRTEGFWVNADVRWLAGVNTIEGSTYVNKESFEELLVWLQLPEILGIAGHLGGDEAYESGPAELAELEGALRAECQLMADAGYNLKTYLRQESELEPEEVEDEAILG